MTIIITINYYSTSNNDASFFKDMLVTSSSFSWSFNEEIVDSNCCLSFCKDFRDYWNINITLMTLKIALLPLHVHLPLAAILLKIIPTPPSFLGRHIVQISNIGRH